MFAAIAVSSFPFEDPERTRSGSRRSRGTRHGDMVAPPERVDLPTPQELGVGATHFHVPLEDLARTVYVERKVNVRVTPVHLGGGTLQRDGLIEIVL